MIVRMPWKAPVLGGVHVTLATQDPNFATVPEQVLELIAKVGEPEVILALTLVNNTSCWLVRVTAWAALVVLAGALKRRSPGAPVHLTAVWVAKACAELEQIIPPVAVVSVERTPTPPSRGRVVVLVMGAGGFVNGCDAENRVLMVF